MVRKVRLLVLKNTTEIQITNNGLRRYNNHTIGCNSINNSLRQKMKKIITIIVIILSILLIGFFLGDMSFNTFEKSFDLGLIPERIDHIVISVVNMLIGFAIAVIAFLLIRE